MSEEEYRNQTPLVSANTKSNSAYAETKEIGSGSRSWTEEQWDFYHWMYCWLVEDVEKQIGCILTVLVDAGLADNTIVVFTSDHGEMRQSHGLVFKSRLLGEAIHTPLIIAGPGVQKGIVDSKNLTCGIDLVLTTCDSAGISIPKGLSGKLLKSILTGQTIKMSRSRTIIELNPGYQIHDGHYRYTAFTRGDKGETLADILSDPEGMPDKSIDPVYRAIRSHLCNLLIKDLNKITQNAPMIK